MLASESEEAVRNTKFCKHNEEPERCENRSGFRNSEGDIWVKTRISPIPSVKIELKSMAIGYDLIFKG